MHLDLQTYGSDLTAVADHARAAEARGFATWLTSETSHDPMLACAAAALATERIAVGTAITVAFARSPMTVAMQAHDIQQALGDRPFVLGLGSQIKPHITKRFAQPWPARPATAMKEFVQAVRAIWDAWQDGAELDVRGEHYTLTLMTPMFTPPPNPRRPAIWVAAVGPGMTRITGEVADGILCHGFTTMRYLRDVTLPALDEGIARVEGRTRADVEVVLPLMTITGYDAEQRQQVRRQVVEQIAFYGSTPAYRPVLEGHGWGDLGEQLTRLSKQGGWGAMADLVPDEVVDAFAVTADPDELGAAIGERCGDLVDRITLPDVLPLRQEHTTALAEALAG